MKSLKKIVLLTLFFASLLLACKQKEGNNNENSTIINHALPYWVRTFKGKLDGVDLVLHLTQSADFHGTKTLGGFYYYAAIQEPIAVYGELSKDGKVKLTQYEHDENAERLEGIFEKNAFVGTWIQPKTKKSAPFRLEAVTEGVNFEYVVTTDSFRLFQDRTASPVATFSMGALLPSQKNDKVLIDLLLNIVYKNMRGDTIERKYAYKDFQNFYDEQKKQFFENYQEMMRGETFEPNQKEFDMNNYYAASDMGLVWNDGKLLSLAFHSSTYTGGAHGNYGTSYISVDLVKKKSIELSDLFKAGFEKTLDQIIEKNIRKKFSIKDNESLDGYLLVEEIHFNNNFAITPKGIMFNYVPYEIASFAQGEIQVFIPFSELKSILK